MPFGSRGDHLPVPVRYRLAGCARRVRGPWQTIWTWHRRMIADRTWIAVLAQLLSAVEEVGIITGRWRRIPRSPALISTPPTSPATQGAGSNSNPRIEPPDRGIGRSRGGLTSKIHHLVDGGGRPLVVLVSAGPSQRRPDVRPSAGTPSSGPPRGGRARTRPERVRAHYKGRNVIERGFNGVKTVARAGHPLRQARHRLSHRRHPQSDQPSGCAICQTRLRCGIRPLAEDSERPTHRRVPERLPLIHRQ